MQRFFIILAHEFQLATARLGKVVQSFLFFIIALSVFFLIAQNQQSIFSPFLAIDAILFCLIFSVIFSNSDFLSQDFSDGTMEQIALSCPNLENFVFAKMIANWLIYCLPILAFIPVIGIALGLHTSFICDFIILTSIASIAMNFICAFCGSLSIAQNKAPMVAILALPLVIPVLLLACGHFNVDGIAPADFALMVKMLIGICVFFGTICVLGVAKVVGILLE